MVRKTAHAALRCEDNKAPNEATVDEMYKALERHIVDRGGVSTPGSDRVHWTYEMGRDWSYFSIYRDYELGQVAS